jgi:hypothetical protein
MSDEFKNLLDAVTKVKALLEAPEEGLLSWNMMLTEAVEETKKAIKVLGVDP